MNPLQKAYSILGLEPGSSKQSIQTRYRRLIMVWHPDRFVSPEDKKHAEDELKKINNAKDLLWKHFDSGTHKASGCECQQSQGPPPPKPPPGPPPDWKKHDDEERAKRRDEERKRKAAEEAARQQEEERKRREKQQTFAEAEKQEAAMKEHKLRWTVAAAEGALLIALCLFGWIGTGIHAAWHDFAWHWEQDHKPKQDENTNTNTNTSTSTTTGTDTSTITTTDITPPPKPVEVDPCSLTGPQPTPPNIIKPNLHNWVRQSVTQWTVKCRGTNEGATVEGTDEKGNLVVSQDYGPNWTFNQQWTIKREWSYGSGDRVSVDLYKPTPFEFVGRSIYRYDRDKTLLEISKVDEHQIPIVTATIQRRPGGGFFGTILKFYNSTDVITNTKTLYQPDDPEMASTFYLFAMFGGIQKTIDQTPNLTSPDIPTILTQPDSETLQDKLNRLNHHESPGFFNPKLPDSQSPLTPSTDTFKDKLDRLNHPAEHSGFFDQNKLPGSGPGVPYTAPSNPFSTTPSSTPGMDALKRRLELQDNK